MGSNAVLISLEDGPVVEGDVKVMFDSSAVSTSMYISAYYLLLRHTVLYLGKACVYPDCPYVLILSFLLGTS